ncbi:MAG: hypothetical protein K2Y71_01260 [Xanthobacteraceae bacterium]|nr:hypothetical protein [Xanthobacteraceae bacterium]
MDAALPARSLVLSETIDTAAEPPAQRKSAVLHVFQSAPANAGMGKLELIQ